MNEMRGLGGWIVAGAVATAGAQVPMIDAITFASEPGALYVPVKDVGFAMGWPMRSEGPDFYLNERRVTIPKTLLDGTRLIPISSLKHLGFAISGEGNELSAMLGDRELVLRKGEKRVVINRATQRLRAYQGERLVMETNVSTGKKGHTTPTGTWSAGPEKSRMRFSRKYDNAPMPWAVQIAGDVFMHGYHSVPKRPASHGCIRVPIRGQNPAKYLWHWIDLGTPVTISTKWPDDGEVAQERPLPKSGVDQE